MAAGSTDDAQSARRRRRHCREIIAAGIAAAAPDRAVRRVLLRESDGLRVDAWRWVAAPGSRLWMIAVGKAAAAMADAAAETAGEWLTGGLLVAPAAPRGVPHGIEVVAGSHPTPGAGSARAGSRALSVASQATEGDLVLCLISGGASSLLAAPVPGVDLAALCRVNELLLRAGVEIGELSVVRKHLSRIKGGRLVAAAWPGSVLALLLSDVIDDRVDVIGSGLTAADSSTYADAVQVLERAELWGVVPGAVRATLRAGVEGELPETPGPEDARLARTYNRVVAGVRTALEGAAAAAAELQYEVEVLTDRLQGPAGAAARWLVDCAAARGPAPGGARRCLLAGGETTVVVRGDGRGGRNQELALESALLLDGSRDVCLASVGTDGIDGPTEAAGAVVDSATLSRARACGLDSRDYLERNDANRYFGQLGDLVITGPTGTNVMDLQVILLG